MKKTIILLVFVTSFINAFSQEQTAIKEPVTTVVKEKAKEVVEVKKEALETKAKETVSDKLESTTNKKSETTTFYLITNGETKKPSEKYPDPYLSNTGVKKAENWIKILSDIKFGAIYAQETTSAKQTAQTIATTQKLGIYALDTKNVYDNSFKYNTKGQNILIVADNAALAYFANTVLDNKKYEMPKTATHNDFYIVTVTDNNITSIKLNIE